MKKLLLLIGICLINSFAFAQEITGAWLGKLNVGVELRVVFNISGSNDSLVSTLDSPDQGAFGIPSSSTTFIKW
ncbi:MAG: hypothetical protein IPO24_17940 [Bacteroidetes bacterium]|nr:hypothetical protein [Bacteroidota bacterium]